MGRRQLRTTSWASVVVRLRRKESRRSGGAQFAACRAQATIGSRRGAVLRYCLRSPVSSSFSEVNVWRCCGCPFLAAARLVAG